MKRTLASVLLALTCLALFAPARAGGDDPSCHQTATQPASDPKTNPMADILTESERVDFFANCKEKGNIASYCTHLTTNIRQRDGSGSNVVIKYFVADKGPCKDKDSVQAYCKLWATYDGLKVLIDESDGYADPMDPSLDMPPHIVDRSAKLCGMTSEVFLSKFCSAAAASKSHKDWNLAVKACPKEGKEIYMHYCVGRKNEYNQPATPQQCEQMYSAKNTIF